MDFRRFYGVALLFIATGIPAVYAGDSESVVQTDSALPIHSPVDELTQRLNGTQWHYESVTRESLVGESGRPDSFYQQTFADKPITFKGHEMLFGTACRLSWQPYFQTPIKYYHSNSTVELYTSLFASAGLNMPEKLTILETTSPVGECPIAGVELIDFGSKLAFLYEDKVVTYTRGGNKQATKPETRKCESGPQDMEYVYEHGAMTRCFYPNMSMNEAYEAHRKERSDSENLLPTLTPGKDLAVEKLGDTERVEYQWRGENVLHITQYFPGGTTEFLLESATAGTTVTETGFPD
ncbi:hypothetical protein CJP72_17405 [Citrobacter sp. NCU1]|uniref:hypothetical protein n=1 Tax=Citrobacter sp. NCU1 TaxID=2026683 RepID=UPI001391919E|nr:hypothetical protein [Citrobacter sp. NCU1]NDO82489.1 hypothetical protein [Citrobacter sp. NCU1]